MYIIQKISEQLEKNEEEVSARLRDTPFHHFYKATFHRCRREIGPTYQSPLQDLSLLSYESLLPILHFSLEGLAANPIGYRGEQDGRGCGDWYWGFEVRGCGVVKELPDVAATGRTNWVCGLR